MDYDFNISRELNKILKVHPKRDRSKGASSKIIVKDKE
jgi:hypothetical protein